MKKILFLIHDLGPGGAEKVLVNLVNNMDASRFEITLMSLFDVGINKQYIAPHIKYKYCFKKMVKGNSHLMKFLSPRQLHRFLIKERYDFEVAYLEGPCARIISGCPDKNTKLFSWIHIEQHTAKRAAVSFRSVSEATKCYNSFHRINCVSEAVMNDFKSCLDIRVPIGVVYNTNESERIKALGKEKVEETLYPEDMITMVGVGKLLKSKGFDRLIKIVFWLKNEGLHVRLLILGVGEEEENLKKLIEEKNLEDRVMLLGYQTNPYKFVSKSDLFVCASYREGFSTAATEALILGIPVCTVDVAGMKEMLGEENEYGIVVPNDDGQLYNAIQKIVSNKGLLERYKEAAKIRGKLFSTENTVRSVQTLFNEIGEYNGSCKI